MNYEQFQDTSWRRRKSKELFEIRSEDCQSTLQWNGGIQIADVSLQENQ
jgi:hypothetical protein